MPKLSRYELANLAVGLPIMSAIIGLMVGVGMGFGVGWAMKPTPELTDVQVAEMSLDAFSAGQIEFKCGQIRGEELKTANERISALEKERDVYEQKVLTLQAELDEKKVKAAKVTSSSQGTRPAAMTTKRAKELESQVFGLQEQLNAARNQLGRVTRQLSQAEEEKKQLQEALIATSTKLRETEVELATQTAKTEEAVQDALSNKWWRFISDSQLEICEKGNRKKMGRCRATVQEYLKTNRVRNRFIHCVRSEQAIPAVGFLEDGKLPRFAVFLDQDSKVTRDWFVQLCDPTLPEAVEDGAMSMGGLP